MATIDFLTLANHAEAQNGLLYLSGAGWTELRRPVNDGVPAAANFGIGLSVLVPWDETNRSHKITIWIEDEDGNGPLLKADGDLTVGRPPNLPAGSDQRSVLAMSVGVAFPAAGGYRLIAELDGERATQSFRVHDIQMVTSR